MLAPTGFESVLEVTITFRSADPRLTYQQGRSKATRLKT